jgi:hypothetical protein
VRANKSDIPCSRFVTRDHNFLSCSRAAIFFLGGISLWSAVNGPDGGPRFVSTDDSPEASLIGGKTTAGSVGVLSEAAEDSGSWLDSFEINVETSAL